MKRTYLFIFLILLYTNLFALYDTIVPGVRYKNIVKSNPAQSIHVLITDPLYIDIKIGIAKDKCTSSQKTTALAKKNNAIAAINGGFFDFGCKNKFNDIATQIFDCLGYSKYKAYPMYTLINDNKHYSLSHIFTGAIGWNNKDQQPIFGIIKTQINLTINGQTCLVNELNKPYPKVPTLYSDCYDEKTPAFDKQTDEIVIENNHIQKIHTASPGRTKIPKNGWVYVLPKGYRDLTASLKEGDFVLVNIAHDQPVNPATLITNENWHTKNNILASTPLLVHNGQIVPDLNSLTSDFYTTKHPRSAIGVLKDGNWVFAVIDGRQKHSEGFTIVQLAEFMRQLGCTSALNLDGGGSSTIVIKDKIVNSPSGRDYCLTRKERPISNVILICAKQ
jgi:hypothetical protein